jgi:hypothetical protein
MNRYEWKQEQRRQRLETRADRLQREGAARIESGMGRLRAIPFGQPILIGHHSEQRDRNYRRKAIASVDKGMELQHAAAETARRAEATGSGGVSSDDPDAVVKLREQLEKCERLQAVMVAANKAIRKGDDEALRALGFNDARIAQLKTPDFCGRIGFADYQTKNNGANIRRLKARIADLERNATRETKETERQDGLRIVENAEANRLQLVFPGKPSAEARAILKRYGFRWAPSEMAWQRQLHNGARYAAECALKAIEALP